MAVVILVPVLARPQNVAPLVESIQGATPETHSVLFICDEHDTAEREAIKQAGGEALVVTGNYAEKINAGVRVTGEPWLFFGADDLRFHPGWFTAAKRVAERTGAGVIGTQDLCNPRVIAGEHATHFLVSRDYAEQPTIDGQPGPLFEGYLHEFVDDELIGTAKKRGQWAFAAESVVEHLHPDAGKSPTDGLYKAQGHRMRKSRPLYEQRRPLWT